MDIPGRLKLNPADEASPALIKRCPEEEFNE
jgi:hypothetical protein